MKLKSFACGLFGVAALLAAVGVANAQAYPNRTVKLYVGAVAGGAPDIIARMLGEKLSLALGQPFVVENRPGAGGTVVPGQVAKMAPDGYNLLVADIAQLVVAPHLQVDVAYDPLKDFAPVAMVATTPLFIISNAKTTTIRNRSDLLSQAKASPGKLNYGSSGIGSIHHIAMEMFKTSLGLDIVHVPYRGSGQSVPALLGGDVPLVVATLPTVGTYVQSGQVHLLAVTSAQRFQDAPDIPAVSESVKGYDFASEIGVIAPAGTPRDVVMRLSAAIKTALEAPEFSARFKVLGTVPTWLGSDDYMQNIRVNYKKFGDAVKASGAKSN